MPDSFRELQRKIPGRDRNLLKDNLLSQDVCVTLLQDNKLAIRRAEMVSFRDTNCPIKFFKDYNRYIINCFSTVKLSSSLNCVTVQFKD